MKIMPKRKGTTRTRAATAASLASRASAAAPVIDANNDEARATNDEQHEPAWRQLDDVLTTAAPFRVRLRRLRYICWDLGDRIDDQRMYICLLT